MKVSHAEEAEDLTHEVFMSAWQNIGSYKSKGFPFSSWLYQIARNRVIDHYRTKKFHTDIESVEGEVAGLEAKIEIDLENSLSLEVVKAMLQKLTPEQQDVILMRFMEERTHKEIAAAMKKSEGSVRLMQHRAVNTLKRLINGKKSEKSKSIFPNKIQEML